MTRQDANVVPGRQGTTPFVAQRHAVVLLRVVLVGQCLGGAGWWLAGRGPWVGTWTSALAASLVIAAIAIATRAAIRPALLLVALIEGVTVLALTTSGTDVTSVLSPISRAVRYLGPIVLLAWLRESPPPRSRESIGNRLARLAIAGTFCGHGIKALLHDPGFVALLAAASEQMLDASPPLATSWTLLAIIGGTDVLLAAAILGSRVRSVSLAVLAWAALWGGVTAMSRWFLLGPEGWFEILIRSANGGLAAALLLGWLGSARHRSVPSEGVEERRRGRAGMVGPSSGDRGLPMATRGRLGV